MAAGVRQGLVLRGSLSTSFNAFSIQKTCCYLRKLPLSRVEVFADSQVRGNVNEQPKVSPLDRFRGKVIQTARFHTENGASLATASSGEIDAAKRRDIRESPVSAVSSAEDEDGEKQQNGVLEGIRVSEDASSPNKPATEQWKVGAFQQLPAVSPAYEIIGSAIRRARMVRPTKGIVNAAKRERNKGAQQLDALTKELSGPLSNYVRKFPTTDRLHAFERSLLELTLGDSVYEQTLQRVDVLRKKILEVGKNAASMVNKTTTKREAEEKTTEGFARLEELYERNSHAVDALKEVAKTLRFMPVVHPRIPTLCLVGAPNVGKSSLVRVISSGKPEVCNYPFTTRGISMGHFFVDGRRHQVTDTPGLLHRPEEKRNNIERLTVAALEHLPVAILYVHDLTGECGTSVKDQFLLHATLKARFSSRPWLDAISKADLFPAPSTCHADSHFQDPTGLEAYQVYGPPGALRVSTETNEGIPELVTKVHEMLAANVLGSVDDGTDPDDDLRPHLEDPKAKRRQEQDDFYFPRLPAEMLRGT